MANKHGHHGGAWKVAYADFVTAMMALFLVLWLTAQDEKIKEAVERAFTHPFSNLEEGAGVIPMEQKKPFNQDSKGSFSNASILDLEAMLRQLQQVLQQTEEEGGNTIEIERTSEGIKISLFDRSKRPIFEPQSSEMTAYGDWVLSTVAWPICIYTNFNVEVEGHTESGRPPVREDYGNWELSADRANTARRRLILYGVEDAQIRKVAGYADTMPLPDHTPEDESNRRVTVMLRARSSTESSATTGVPG